MKKQYQATTILPFIGVLLLASVITLFLFLRFTLLPTPTSLPNTAGTFEPVGNPLLTGVTTPEQKMPTIRPDDFSYGAADAPVTIIIYSDFSCPYCKDMAALLKNEVTSNKKARVVWRDFPVMSVHPEALLSHTAAWCAGQKGKFWEFHDGLFATADHSQAAVLALGTQVGLQSNAFTTCMQSSEAKNAILQNVQEGNALGIDGTPYLFINDQRVSGLISAEELAQIVTLHATIK